jgi:hypothetical protein
MGNEMTPIETLQQIIKHLDFERDRAHSPARRLSLDALKDQVDSVAGKLARNTTDLQMVEKWFERTGVDRDTAETQTNVREVLNRVREVLAEIGG